MTTRDLPDDHRMPGHQYTLGEMREMIKKMRAVSSAFYGPATHTGCHAFIEFCGLQNEFIKICETALDQGIEFPFANTHSKTTLPVREHHATYLGEKFDCIYGHTIGADPKLRAAFLHAAFKGAEPEESSTNG